MSDVKVTVSEQKTYEVTKADRRGRTIVVRKASVLDRANFLLSLGDAAQNRQFMNEFSVISWLYSIDGEPVKKPQTLLEVQAIISRLGDDGYTALQNGAQELIDSYIDDNYGDGDLKN